MFKQYRLHTVTYTKGMNINCEEGEGGGFCFKNNGDHIYILVPYHPTTPSLVFFINNLDACCPFTAYMSSPCHIELILAEREQAVPRPGTTDDEPVKKKVSQKKLKRQKMMMRD